MYGAIQRLMIPAVNPTTRYLHTFTVSRNISSSCNISCSASSLQSNEIVTVSSEARLIGKTAQTAGRHLWVGGVVVEGKGLDHVSWIASPSRYTSLRKSYAQLPNQRARVSLVIPEEFELPVSEGFVSAVDCSSVERPKGRIQSVCFRRQNSSTDSRFKRCCSETA
jgi:hypothetical protein